MAVESQVSAVERAVERLILGSRWLQVPLYVGLILALALFVLKFFQQLWHMVEGFWGLEESQMVLVVLALIDIVMVANLLIMVVISGYENFVSRIEVRPGEETLSWFGKLDHGSIKIKLATSIVAISSIHLLKAFLDAEHITSEKLLWLVVIHLTFVFSALLMAYLDRLISVKH